MTAFAFGEVGFAGVRSAGEKEYDAIMGRPDRPGLLARQPYAGVFKEAEDSELIALVLSGQSRSRNK